MTGTATSETDPIGSMWARLVEDGAVTAAWDLDTLRETEDCVTDYNVFVMEPTPTGHVAAAAALRMSGLTEADTVWIRLVADNDSH